jgi:hypothetical protein
MKNIKKLKTGELIVEGMLYTPYLVGELPITFGFKYNAEKDQDGYSEWFNYKGLTYIIKK